MNKATTKEVVEKMTPKEKMQKLIKNKQGGGKDIQRSIAKNDQKYMRKAPIIFK